MTRTASLSASLAVASLVLLGTLASTSVARADHSWYAGAGAGFYNDLDCCSIHGRVQGEIGWHFSGDMTGFFLEIDVMGTFGRHYWMFTSGVRLGGDIEVYHDAHFHLLLRPSGFIGFAVRDYDGDGWGPWGGIVIQPAFDARFVLADGLIALWLRPVAFDFLIWWDTNDRHDWYGSAAYQLLGGIDFQF